MAGLLTDLTAATQVAFVLLALATLADWLRHRDRQRTFLVLALISLSLVVIVAPIAGALGLDRRLSNDVALVIFVLSGFFLLLFRDVLIPLGTRAKWIITGAVAVVCVVAIAADLPTDPNAPRTSFQIFAISLVVVTWIVCVGEPVIRLALASIGRPAVQGARLRALSVGYTGLVAVLAVATVGGSIAQHPAFALVTDIVVLLVVPLLYASFSPPVWLRRIWSQPEQDAIRNALHDLLLYSPDRAVLAERALEWGGRLVGGAGACIVDSDGSILAAQGMTHKEAALLAATTATDSSILRIPLDLQQGQGMMTIRGGPFIPVFGQYEVDLLRGYGVSVTAGLDRVLLTERIAALEKAKTEFLNIASHELRGPMTVIKGYLTMLTAGTLGEISPRAMSVMPLLIAKADEIISMLEQMIEASRLEDGRLALKRERSDITELTDAAIETLRPLLTDHQLKVDKPLKPLWADVDPDRFQIVVKNLVANAVKFSPPGSSVTVRISDGETMTLAVSDEGVGIAGDDLPKLFTRFGRIESPATINTPGTGLGLWLSREIARMHDGDLTVKSEVKKGSTFTLEIPLNRN